MANTGGLYDSSPRVVAEVLAEQEASPTDGWRTIESAPEKTNVLVYIPKAKRETVRVGRYGIKSNGNRLWTYGGEFGFDVGVATHWMPLPAPPRGKE